MSFDRCRSLGAQDFISLNGTTVNVTSSAMNYGGTKGVGTPTNFAGLAHAFLNANNLSSTRSAISNSIRAASKPAPMAGLCQCRN